MVVQEEETNKIKLFAKIQEAKVKFLNAGVKKSGWNNGFKYHYYELKDIVPPALKIFSQLNLATQFKFDQTIGKMIVYDLDTGYSTEYTSPLPILDGRDTREAMQNIGAVETYTRRYLYLQLFDVVETDQFDIVFNKSKNKKGKQNNKKKPELNLKEREIAKDIADSIVKSGKELNQNTIRTELVKRLENNEITSANFTHLMEYI
ncbi:MAG: hypothetical protein E7Z84_02665 [Methanosphaera stadtmanae]|nr:hypothetical protein [Methanosphaera stadtmanae]